MACFKGGDHFSIPYNSYPFEIMSGLTDRGNISML